MLDAILKGVQQMNTEEFYKFCSELFYYGQSGVFYCDSTTPEDKPKFIGLMCEIVESVGGEKDGNR